MRGSRAILALAALVLVLGATALWSQDLYSLPFDRSINAGRSTIKYDNHSYVFVFETAHSVRFEKIDQRRVLLTIKPATRLIPREMVSVQWDNFPAITLTLDLSGGDSFILHTETGYAEK
jgi:hypothetical protein